MVDIEEKRRTAVAELVFLALFAASLVLAKIIVAQGASIVLSSPRQATGTPLFAKVPTGKHWLADENWKFDGRGLVLTSRFMTGSNTPDIQVACRYIFQAADAFSERIPQMAARTNSRVIENGRFVSGILVFDWGHLNSAGSAVSLFYATAKLPDGKVLDIEVVQTTGDTEFAKKIFMMVMENVEYRDSDTSRKITEFDKEVIVENFVTG